MIPCAYGKKIKKSHSSEVTLILTKGMITFCWWKIVRIIMVTENSPKIYERMLYNIIYGER